MAKHRICRLVVFSDDWGRHPSSSQFLLGGLMPDCEVVWVNSIGMRSPRLRVKDMRRIVERLRRIGNWDPAGSGPGPTPTIIQPRFLPYHHIGSVRRLNKRLVGDQVRARLADISAAPTVVWVSYPMAAYLVESIDYDYLVYYCCDEFTGMPDVRVADVIRNEDWLLSHADLCAFSAPSLQEAKSDRVTGESMLLSHGVHLANFPGTLPEPHPSVRDVPHPALGFFGSFQDWIDVPLVETLARRRPAWTICLVGEPDERVRRLQSLANVKICGRVPHAELSRYAATWDAGMLVYDNDHPFTAGISPLKGYEYYALGLPIVSTRAFHDLDGQEFLHVGAGIDAFIAAAETAIATPAESRAEIRRVAERNTWDLRTDQLRDALRKGLAL